MKKQFMYLSQLKQEHEQEFSMKWAASEAERSFLLDKLSNQEITCFQIFRFQRLIFMYLEAEADYEGFSWPEEYQELFEAWPGAETPRFIIPLLDIFHDGNPETDAQWRTGFKPEECKGMLARLKPEMYASYVYYHYQLQEEKPGSFNKFYRIGSFENYIFAYYELPSIQPENALKGKLQSNQTPDNWQEVMLPHFEPWGDLEPGQNLWRSMETVFSYSAE